MGETHITSNPSDGTIRTLNDDDDDDDEVSELERNSEIMGQNI